MSRSPDAKGRHYRMLSAVLLSAGAELTLATAAAVSEEWFPDEDDSSLPLLACLFVICMALWYENRLGRTRAAFQGFVIVASLASVCVAALSADCWLWLALSAAILAFAAACSANGELFRRFGRARRARSAEFARFATLGRISAELFHDLANPLTAVSLAVADLDRNARSAETQQARERVDHALSAARQLETQLERARNQVKARGDSRTFSGDEELERIVRSLGPLARRFGVETSVIAEEPLDLVGDPIQFYRAFSNLVANAIEAHDPTQGGTAVVRTWRGTTGTTVTVHDDGAGMDRKTLTRAFKDRFTTKADGLGLGLTIARDILVHEFGAALSISSAPGEGTIVTASFPRP